jgi:glycosyltransferase involved in cell wall biosynthesis
MGWQDHIELVIVGASSQEPIGDSPFKIHTLGQISDDIALALVYGAVDLFVTPSHMDTLPNMAIESMACGTPCVAYAVGGLPDIIDHEFNGYLAPLQDFEALVKGIRWCLENNERWQKLTIEARLKVEREFNIKRQVGLYLDLYRELTEYSSPVRKIFP